MVASPETLPFPRADFDRRLQATRDRMARAGLDLLVVTDPANMNYLTGYDGWSFYVPQLLLLHLEEAAPWWIGRQQDVRAAMATTWLADARIHGYPDHYVQADGRHPMDFVADFIAARPWRRAVIGVEKDACYFTAASLEALQRRLPDATFPDATLLVNQVRAVKTEPELACLRQAARIAERAMQAAYDAILPGVRQCDAAAAILAAQTTGTDGFGGEFTAICPLLPTGTGTGTPHLTWTDAPFRRGEATIIELAGVRRRYHCPMARTVHLGPPPARLADTAAVVLEGMAAALDTARPGATAEEVERAWRTVIARHGLAKESRIGYSIGIGYPPDWGEHTISLRPGDRTVLVPNHCFHMILGLWMDGWGLEISEAFRVTDGAPECFASFDRPLFVKD